MKRLVAFLLSLTLVVAACGDDAAADPSDLNSCEGLAGAGLSMLQETIDLIDGLDAAALAEFADPESEPSPEFAALEERGNELTARADEIGCSDEEMTALLVARVDELSADSVFGQFILESVRTGDGDFFGD